MSAMLSHVGVARSTRKVPKRHAPSPRWAMTSLALLAAMVVWGCSSPDAVVQPKAETNIDNDSQAETVLDTPQPLEGATLAPEDAIKPPGAEVDPAARARTERLSAELPPGVVLNDEGEIVEHLPPVILEAVLADLEARGNMTAHGQLKAAFDVETGKFRRLADLPQLRGRLKEARKLIADREQLTNGVEQ